MSVRRIIEELPPSMHHERSTDARRTCKQAIKLDGEVYRCGRDHVDGVHDAFKTHSDGGMVRW